MANKEDPRRRLPREVRRDEILAAALAVFSELGFGRATLNDVAEGAGVTKGALYHYFESKEQLFIALLRERLMPHIEAGEEGPAPPTRPPRRLASAPPARAPG